MKVISEVLSTGNAVIQLSKPFLKSLNKLSKTDKSAVKLAIFELQTNPTRESLRLHELFSSRGFWSIRVRKHLRIILHVTATSDDAKVVVCYVNFHDKAYAWAENRVAIPAPAGMSTTSPETVDVSTPRPATADDLIQNAETLADKLLKTVASVRRLDKLRNMLNAKLNKAWLH